MNIWFYDIEVYPNYFLAIFKNRNTGEWKIIEILKQDNGELVKFLQTKPKLIGYNNLAYDAQILEYIYRNPRCTVEQIKIFNDQLINSTWPTYRAKQLSTDNLDVMEINNYGARSAKSTSLKKIEFFLRKKSIKDLPYHFNQVLKSHHLPNVRAYCKYDVNVTEDIYYETKIYAEIRAEISNMLGKNFYNYAEPKLAREWFAVELGKKMGLSRREFLDLRTKRDKIVVKDIILPYIAFNSSELQEVLDFYNNTIITATGGKINLKKQISYTKEFKGGEYFYGSGGLHQSLNGVFTSDERHVILDVDFSSFYPCLAIENNFYPEHLDKNYLVQYKKLYTERQTKYPKKTHYNMNYLWKIFLNSVYGQSNNEYSPFYDPLYTAKTCINGQLTLSMLVERFADIPGCQILQTNTDGTTIRVSRAYLDVCNEIIKDFEKITNLELETVEYRKIVIRDVNNYLGIYNDDSTKAIGVFQTYESMKERLEFHKDPSMNIIPLALHKYYVEGISLEETINNHNNIFDFCAGVKGKRSFMWMISSINDGMVSHKLLDNRMIRYYVGGNQTLSKLFLRNGKSRLTESVTAVEATSPVTVCQSLRRSDIVRKKRVRNKEGFMTDVFDHGYQSLDREWYINKTKEIINEVNK